MRPIVNRFNNQEYLILIAACISLILSFWFSARDNIINPDGICYLMSAQYFEVAGIKGVAQFCPQSQWPLYSLLIFGMTQLTHLSYLHAAQLLDAFLTMTSVISFLLIVQMLGGNKRVLMLAALTILFDHQMNVLRDNVIRDHGFWASYLLSMYLLLKFYQKPAMRIAILWSGASIIATLFRIEGAVFFILMPLTAFFVKAESFKIRLKYASMLNVPLLIIAFAGVIFLVTHPQYTLDHLGRVNELFNQILNGWDLILNRYHSAKNVLAQYILPPEGYPDAKAITILIWLNWYLYNVVLTFSLGYTLLLIYAWFSKALPFERNSKVVIIAAVMINVMITMAFLAEHLFVSKRYLIALSLTFMIWVPFAIERLMGQWHNMKQRLFLMICVALIIGATASGIVDFGYPKSYLREAGVWVSENIPKDAKVYGNDKQVMYYSKHYGNNFYNLFPQYKHLTEIRDDKWKQYDYLVIRIGSNPDEETRNILNSLKIAPIKLFKNNRGNQVVIYRIKKEGQAL